MNDLDRQYADLKDRSVERKAQKAARRAVEHRRRWMFQHVPRIAAAMGLIIHPDYLVNGAIEYAEALYESIDKRTH